MDYTKLILSIIDVAACLFLIATKWVAIGFMILTFVICLI